MSEFQLNNNIFNLADSITNAFRKAASAAPSPRLIRWNNNNCQCTVLNVDGSCLGVPIRAGFGDVFPDNTGTYIAGYSGYISHS